MAEPKNDQSDSSTAAVPPPPPLVLGLLLLALPGGNDQFPRPPLVHSVSAASTSRQNGKGPAPACVSQAVI